MARRAGPKAQRPFGENQKSRGHGSQPTPIARLQFAGGGRSGSPMGDPHKSMFQHAHGLEQGLEQAEISALTAP